MDKSSTKKLYKLADRRKAQSRRVLRYKRHFGRLNASLVQFDKLPSASSGHRTDHGFNRIQN